MKKKIKQLMLALIVAVSAMQLGYAQTSYATTITLDGQSIIKEKNGTTTTIGQGTVVQVTDLQEHILSGSSQNGNGVNYNRLLVKNGMVFEVEFPSHYTNFEKIRGSFSIITGANGKTRLRFTGAGGFGCSYETVVGGVTQVRRISGHVNYYGVLQLGNAANSSTQDAPSTLIVVDANATHPLGQGSGTLYVTEDQVLSVPSGKFPGIFWASSLPNQNSFINLHNSHNTNISSMQIKNIILKSKEEHGSGISEFNLRIAFYDGSSNILSNGTPGSTSQKIITIRDGRITDKKVTSIQLNPPQLHLAQGQESTITATILPQDASNTTLNWQSSHPALVTVDQQGKVRVIGTPNQDTPVTISATASDGSNVVGTMQVLLEGKKYTVTAESNNTAWGAVNPATQTVNANTQVTVTASTIAPHKFKHWIDKASNSVVSTNANYSFNVTKNITLQAVFEEAVQKFTVTAESNNTTWGTVNPASQTVNANTQVTVTASTIAPHKFKHWIDKASNSVVSTNANYSFNVTKNITLQAVFEEAVQKFTVTAESNNTTWGTVNPASQTVNANTQVTVTASTIAPHKFKHWIDKASNSVVSTNPSYSFTATKNVKLQAVFEEVVQQFTVTAESNNTAWGTVNPATQTVNANTQVTVTATAQQGFNFIGWFENGNLVHNQSAYTFNVTANRTLEARFAAQPKPKFTITTSVKDNLGGSASPQAQEIEQGQAATVTATAQQGFNFVGWFENGNLVHNQATYTFNVSANRTLEARFAAQPKPKFTITTSVKDNLGGSASPQTQEIEQGQPATVTAVAQQGFDFLGWFENGNLVHNQTTYTFNVTANRTLEARFNEVINPKNLLPHLKNFGSAPFKKGQQYEPFIWEEMIPNANPNSFKIIVINSTSSTILESNNYSVTKNDQEGLSISFKQTGKFTVTIQFEAEGQTYFVSYDIVVE